MGPDPQLEPLAPTDTSDTARGLGDRGTSDRGTVTEAIELLLDRALIETAAERREAARLLRALETLPVLPLGPLEPGARLWLRLMRFLAERDEMEAARRLFARDPDQTTTWARKLLDATCPVGQGVALDAMVGATFGVPLQANASMSFSLIRTTATDFTLIRRGVLQGGFDTGVGAGVFLRLGTQGVGATAGAQAQAGLQITAHEEMRFPVLTDSGWIPLLVYMAGGSVVEAAFARCLGALSPEPYRRRVKLEAKLVANAEAASEAGVRSTGTNSGGSGQRVSRSTWTRAEGKQEDSRRESVLTDPRDSDALVNWRGVVHTLLRASLGTTIAMGAGGGIEVAPTYARNADGAWELRSVQLQLYAEGDSAIGLVAKIPTLGGSGLSLEGGGGVRGIWLAKPPFDKGSVQFVRYELYLKSGDLDVFDGPASEVTLAMPTLDAAHFTSLQTFLAGISGAALRHRFALGAPLGRRYLNALSRNKDFTVMLSPKYQEWGFYAVGFLTVKLTVPRKVLVDVLGRLGELLVEGLKEDAMVAEAMKVTLRGVSEGVVPPDLPEAIQRAVASVVATAAQHFRVFLDTGRLPPSLQSRSAELLDRIAGTVETVELHAELGVGLAAGITAAKGAKVRVNGSVSGRRVHERDVAPLLRAELKGALLKAADLLALLSRQWFDEPTEAFVTPEDLRKK